MDDQSAFDHEANIDYDDVAIDAPDNIGSDERRMHVRAYNHWVSLLKENEFPSVEDLDPERLSDFGPHSVLLDFTAGSQNPIIAYLGEALNAECDLSMNIETMSEVPPRSLLSRLTDHYLQIIANRAPVGFEAEFINQRGHDTMYRGILLPFSSDGDTIDFIYGVINWKEGADSQLISQLTVEVEQVFAPTLPPVTMPSEVWADGPSQSSCIQPTNDLMTMDIDVASLLNGSDSLADGLATVRAVVDTLGHNEQISRNTLYLVLSLTYDFSLVAHARSSEFAELLQQAGIKSQHRAPMTALLKLIFGVDYDKTRLTEYATVLLAASARALPARALEKFLLQFKGGIKALVAEVRASKQAAKPRAAGELAARARAQQATPKAIYAFSGNDEFVILVARRVDAEHVAIIGEMAHHDMTVRRALQHISS